MSASRERPSRTLVVDGEEIVVSVRESPRARRMRIVASPRRPLELVVPRRVATGEIDRMLEQHRDWIREQTRKARSLDTGSGALGLDRAGRVPLAGAHVPVERLGGRRSRAELRDGRLQVLGPEEQALDAVARWYRREARARIEEAVIREGARLGIESGPIAIRDQLTRWGSCSSSGRLSVNWRLVLAPPVVLDYVVVHELCHIREPNHSPRFWRLVDDAVPSWRGSARWLREHAFELQRFVPGAAALRTARSGGRSESRVGPAGQGGNGPRPFVPCRSTPTR
jgi:predicted metal-dependent hydrolase